MQLSLTALSTDVLHDYWQLTKPKVVALMLLTAWVGMVLAQSTLPSLPLTVTALGGIGLLAAAAAALNHLLEGQRDTLMARTRRRPVACGRVSPSRAALFALILALSGFGLLYLGVNPLTAWLTLGSLVGYAGIYTLLLKRSTPQNIVIGGLAGAMPPLLGWTSISGTLSAEPWLLVMIIFTWTPPTSGRWPSIVVTTTPVPTSPCYRSLTASTSPSILSCSICCYSP
ncbi:protoheme IX farnesyltransferase [Aeromonas diversa CDC 2478-85]|uniref:Protoheme IX farnesyltransferase n=1 Tax=Aeromonas diversa CDC 2478-85 TaxID=1268237 RepID=N9TY02_9GAMM|nr:protoheme IX farnesyltransferase [Aeromonas diversa CDC 2478-85]